jgi:ornithine decarboxylase
VNLDSRERIERFLAAHPVPTPALVLDIEQVVRNYQQFVTTFDGARICYAVKANPEPALVAALAGAGASFDVASPGEIDLCLSAGARPEALSYGNTVKKPSDITYAYERGVRSFTTDAESDVHALARFAPGARITVRLLVEGPASATPFGRKFGTPPARAPELVRRIARLGLVPAGVGFHVGSQQTDVTAWRDAVAAAAKVCAVCADQGQVLPTLNIGGGFAVPYRAPVPPLHAYAEAVRDAVRANFGAPPELILEPGRAVVADAGLIRTEIVLVAPRSADGDERWVYLDAGRYNGLAETENEAITYWVEPVRPSDPGAPSGPVVLAGPTCDGDDVLYQRNRYRMPLSLHAGQQLDILAAGAYTASYSSVAFNGVPPLRTYCVTGEQRR